MVSNFDILITFDRVDLILIGLLLILLLQVNLICSFKWQQDITSLNARE
jgi:hypothetical protein